MKNTYGVFVFILLLILTLKAQTQYDNFVKLFPKVNSNGIYFIKDINEPTKFFKLFATIFEIVSNKKKHRNEKIHHIADQIKSTHMYSNLIVFMK